MAVPDDSLSVARPPAEEKEPRLRLDRLPLLGFVADSASETVLREALADVLPSPPEFRRGNIRTAIAALQKMDTPSTLIVDVSGEDRPLNALADFADVVEPGARVLVIGDLDDLNFYRHVTRGLGAIEYLYKPLTRDMVARHFGPLLARRSVVSLGVQGGRLVSVTGVRGGVGASTIAAHLAWQFGVEARRHTVLVDTDLYRGVCALLLHAKAGPGLRIALETPDRIDSLFVERAAQPASARLHVLASEEKLSEPIAYAPGATQRLIEALRQRYNFVIIDLPFSPQPMTRDLLDLVQQRVLVIEPSITSVRDALRLMALPNGPSQPRRPTLVVNRSGIPGGLKPRQLEEALKLKPDVTIPYLPRLVGSAANLGLPGEAMRGPFRAGILALSREVAILRNDSVTREAQAQLARRFRLFGSSK